MFWQRKGNKAARIDNWKWVDSARGSGLFDLANDIGEEKDMSLDRPDVLKRITAGFAQWQLEMAAADPRGPFRDY